MINTNRIKEIYDKTKKEIADGADIYMYIPVFYDLIKKEDYESAEGIRLAISDLGLQLTIPEDKEQLQKFYNDQLPF